MEENTLYRLGLLAERTKQWDKSPAAMDRDTRQEFAMMFASVFRRFEDFAEIGMLFVGFSLSDIQRDIAQYMQHGPKKRMVQAQRGEAKSTLAALYAVWALIQDQNYRVLIVSGGEKQASDVAILIIRLIERWHLMCWLRPDKTRGDRTSFENYDVHCDLKRPSASASVACVGITAQLQGKRADLLIPDDIETTKNSLTQTMRDTLLLLSKEFAAINRNGETLYLGTPQTKDSIYKTLIGRGFSIRIWPGRFPTLAEEEKYLSGTLAPIIIDRMLEDPSLRTGGGLDGTRGKPTDPALFDEDAEIEKELDFGPEGYQLQFMLDTSLADAQRTKIKLQDILVYSGDFDRVPEIFTYNGDKKFQVLGKDYGSTAIEQERMYIPASYSSEYQDFQYKTMIIDPAGNGGDEIAYSIGGASNSYIHLFSVGGYQGGTSKENLNKLIDICVEFNCKSMKIEKNMGHGTVEQLMIAELEKRKITDIGVEGFYSAGQKERRIIDTISPVTRRHKFIVHERAIRDDWDCCKLYSHDKRSIVSAFYQLANITYDKGSLAKDDRADTISDLVRELNKVIALDDKREEEKREKAAAREFIENPMGYISGKKRKNNRVRRLGT